MLCSQRHIPGRMRLPAAVSARATTEAARWPWFRSTLAVDVVASEDGDRQLASS